MNDDKQDNADRIPKSGHGDLWASRTDNTVYIINHTAKWISYRWTPTTLSLSVATYLQAEAWVNVNKVLQINLFFVF